MRKPKSYYKFILKDVYIDNLYDMSAEDIYHLIEYKDNKVKQADRWRKGLAYVCIFYFITVILSMLDTLLEWNDNGITTVLMIIGTVSLITMVSLRSRYEITYTGRSLEIQLLHLPISKMEEVEEYGNNITRKENRAKNINSILDS